MYNIYQDRKTKTQFKSSLQELDKKNRLRAKGHKSNDERD